MTGIMPSNNNSRRTRLLWLLCILLFGAAAVVLIQTYWKQEMEVTISATFTNLPENLLLSAASQREVTLEISGSPMATHQIDPETLTYELDLSGLNQGAHIIPLSPANITLPEGFSLLKLLTPSLSIKLETQRPTKQVDIVAVLEGQPAPGFAVAGITLQPDHIVLEGPAPKLAKIDTVKTRPIALETASGPFKKEVPLDLPESSALTPSARIVVAQIDVRERIVTLVLENLPVSAKGLDSGYRITPETIDLTLTGPEGVVKTVETDPAFTATVDVTNLSPGTYFLKAAINLPVRVNLVQAKPEQFEVKIAPK